MNLIYLWVTKKSMTLDNNEKFNGYIILPIIPNCWILAFCYIYLVLVIRLGNTNDYKGINARD